MSRVRVTADEKRSKKLTKYTPIFYGLANNDTLIFRTYNRKAGLGMKIPPTKDLLS